MLMFNNALFMSFIPQLLMVLGFLSCLIAPKLAGKQQNEQAAIVVSDEKTIAYQSDIQRESKIFHYFDNHYLSDNFVADKNENYSHSTVSTRIFYPDFKVYFNRLEICLSLFSRPPPFHLFY